MKSALELRDELLQLEEDAKVLALRRLTVTAEMIDAVDRERKEREIAEWEAIRVLALRSEIGEVVTAATWWTPTPGGRIRKCLVGAGIRDAHGIRLLAVYELTDYRTRTMSLIHGVRPPVDLVLEIERQYLQR